MAHLHSPSHLLRVIQPESRAVKRFVTQIDSGKYGEQRETIGVTVEFETGTTKSSLVSAIGAHREQSSGSDLFLPTARPGLRALVVHGSRRVVALRKPVLQEKLSRIAETLFLRRDAPISNADR